jgi:hypothetical protein
VISSGASVGTGSLFVSVFTFLLNFIIVLLMMLSGYSALQSSTKIIKARGGIRLVKIGGFRGKVRQVNSSTAPAGRFRNESHETKDGGVSITNKPF